MFLGIEIGGTKLQLGVGEGHGDLLAVWRGAVDVAAGADGIRRQILDAVPELLARAGLERTHIRGVGIGFGGPIDDAARTVIKSHHIQGWDNFPLTDWIGDLLGWPAVLGNDADVAGLAEALFGAGKGLSPIFYVTIGSGIGGGLIIDGEIYRGTGRGAAEIGHLRLPAVSSQGIRHLVLEQIASGWAIQEWAKHEMAQKQSLTLLWQLAQGKPENVTASLVAEAARRRDDAAWYILYRAWDHLADAITNVIALLAPRRIIVGGGVSLMGEDLLFAPLRKLVAERVFQPFADGYDIVAAALGEEVVVHGALALARKRLL